MAYIKGEFQGLSYARHVYMYTGFILSMYRIQPFDPHASARLRMRILVENDGIVVSPNVTL